MTKDYLSKLIPFLKAEGYVFDRATKHNLLYSHPTRPSAFISKTIDTKKIYQHELRKIQGGPK